MIDIRFIIKDFLESKSFQEFINRRFKDIDSTGKHIRRVMFSSKIKNISYDGKTLFYYDDMNTIEEVLQEYNYDNIYNTDIVLDIGGYVGAYGLQISHNVKHVYIVEPITDELIRKNIELTNKLYNSIHNVDIFKCALGENNKEIEVKYFDNVSKVKSFSLTKIKEMCGGHIDVLKLDCEGGEWFIEPHEIEDIRKIEMELHIGQVGSIFYSKDKKVEDFINMLTYAGFECKYKITHHPTYSTTLIHATNTKGRFNGN